MSDLFSINSGMFSSPKKSYLCKYSSCVPYAMFELISENEAKQAKEKNSELHLVLVVKEMHIIDNSANLILIQIKHF